MMDRNRSATSIYWYREMLQSTYHGDCVEAMQTTVDVVPAGEAGHAANGVSANCQAITQAEDWYGVAAARRALSVRHEAS